MAKANKKNDLGTNILYRVVMAIMAACVPVAAYFGKLFYTVVESDVFAMLAQIKGDSTDDGSTADYWSIQKLVNDVFPLISGNSENKSSLSTIWDAISPIRGALVCTVVFFAIAVIISVVLFFFAIFMKKKFPQFILAACGLVSMIAMFISFKAMATPLTDGSITLSNFFNASLISAILPYIASFSVFQVSAGWFTILFLFIGLTVWSGAYVLVESGEKKSK